MYGTAEAFGLAGNHHTNHSADLMAGGIVGWQRGSRKKKHGDVLQARAGRHNRAEILAGDFVAFGLGKDDFRRFVVKDVERGLRGGDNHDMVTIFFKDCPQRTCDRGIRHHTEDTNLIRER